MIQQPQIPIVQFRSTGLMALLLVWLLAFHPSDSCGQEKTAEVLRKKRRPNVIIIYADDQGTLDLNCYGSKDLITPNLDVLAQRGVRFTSMYSPSAICSASRAGLMTGLYPARAGVPGNVSSKKGVAGMPTDKITLAEHFKANGYRTGHVGKWHLGYTPETMPNSQGFDESFGHMGGCIDNYSHFFYWNGPNRHDLWENGQEVFRDGEYFGDLMVERCRELINEKSESPFFIYWAINWPHYPLQGTSKWRAKYKSLPHPRDKYATFVSTMDEMIGKVIGQIDKSGQRDNTIILYQSDHGHSVEERAFFGGGNPGIYRGAKGSLFEAGIRVPSIISWPGVIPENETRSQAVTGTDWAPTLLDLANAKPNDKHESFDGRSIEPVIVKDEPSPHEYLYWLMGRGEKAQWAVRAQQWKLIGNPRDPRKPNSLGPEDQLFLANLKSDPRESKNVLEQNPEVVKRLQEIHERLQAQFK